MRSRPARSLCGILTLCFGLHAACALPAAAKDSMAQARQKMVDEEIVGAGVKDPRVIKSMRDTPRHEFVNSAGRANAYLDMALPIGDGQTISPPFIVAYMTEQLLPQSSDSVLEIGTGSGYQAAILSPLVKDVYTIEIVKPLGERAARTLKRLKYSNVHTKIGDGYQGWAEHAPFDKIIVTCSPEDVPPKLVEQLREGGRMIVPVGERYQQTLYLFTKKDGKLSKAALLPALFVPMTGKAEAGRQVLPDPAKPAITNGSFEELTELARSESNAPADAADGKQPAAADKDEAAKKAIPAGWYYQRQLKVVEADDAPEGKRYITFTNEDPGRGANALQGMPVDGRKVDALSVAVSVKAKNIRPGSEPNQLGVLAIIFYGEHREQVGFNWVGPWRDSFPWQRIVQLIPVPPKAREAIVRIGLSGGTGELSFDDIHIEAAK